MVKLLLGDWALALGQTTGLCKMSGMTQMPRFGI